MAPSKLNAKGGILKVRPLFPLMEAENNFWPNASNVVNYWDGPFPTPDHNFRGQNYDSRLVEVWYDQLGWKQITRSYWTFAEYVCLRDDTKSQIWKTHPKGLGEGEKQYMPINVGYATSLIALLTTPKEKEVIRPAVLNNSRWLETGMCLRLIYAPHHLFPLNRTGGVDRSQKFQERIAVFNGLGHGEALEHRYARTRGPVFTNDFDANTHPEYSIGS